MDNYSDKNNQEEAHRADRREFIKLVAASSAGALTVGSSKNAAAAAGIGGNKLFKQLARYTANEL